MMIEVNVRASTAVDAVISGLRMLDHPFYQAWSAGRLTRDALQSYAAQYFHHVEAFPQAVSRVHASCPDRMGRRMLAENLAEEEGLEAGKSDHASLWMDFAVGLGQKEQGVRSVDLNDETVALISTFREMTSKSYAHGLGALYAYESQLPDVAGTKIDGLKAFYDIDDNDTLRFFTVHQAADVEHAEVCRTLIDNLPLAEQADAAEGAAVLSKALLGFLSGMQRTTGIH